MSKHSDEIRNKYIKNPPEGMTADDIRHMGEDDLLDMDYFLNEDDVFDEDFPVLKVFISSKNLSFICYARLCAGYFYIKSSPKENFPIKQKKPVR